MMTRKVKGQDYIGVFDSGVGGLSVLRELKKLMPHEQFIFLADQAYVPYGEKTTKELQARTEKILKFFMQAGAKIVVVACNTATCHAITHLRSRFNLPIVGTEPAIKPAAKLTKSGTIGLIATPATARSDAVTSLIRKFAKEIKVIRVGCPGLEDAVETGGWQSSKIKPLLERYLGQIKSSGADRLVLGCTHYPFLKRQIRGYLGRKISLIDGNLAIAKQTRRVLNDQNLRTTKKGAGKTLYITTGDPTAFKKTATLLLRHRVTASKISLD